jgi:signal transduction histidine kinase
MTVLVHSEVATVSVADHGCGIQAGHLPHIFDRFYRADRSRARTTGGFGLGLAIAKSLVTLYEGHIGVESGPGEGTRITVIFPTFKGLVIERQKSDSIEAATDQSDKSRRGYWR